ncbi:MAG: FAD-dependent oxidoreductase [Bacteroidota bacterium]|nr:FAD-dependent oxidoreductase [Bacteroidota bacterium]MDP3146287.1 FAD-dependent oxidoreductase [Bacteroidota bacterium]
MIEFIIVGRGLAASVIAHALHQENISFKIIGNESLSNCSKVAAGIWNPIVFKRLTKSWLADEIIPYLNQFYSQVEKKVNKKLITQRALIKPFTEEQEKKLWQKKASLELSDFLDDTIYNADSTNLNNCKIINQYGIVKQSGNLDVNEFLKSTNSIFTESVIDEVFDYNELKINSDFVSYKNIKTKNIIFCEGYLVKNNPHFNWIKLKPAKGEVLTLVSSDLKLKNQILNRNGFLMDLDNDTFKLGATYEWDDLSEEPTQKGLVELQTKLQQLISCEYTIQSHQAGVRPSSSDRRPIIGPHPAHKNLFIFNGLGTKGVMLAPYFAKKFVNFYLKKETLHNDVMVNRFYSQYAQ